MHLVSSWLISRLISNLADIWAGEGKKIGLCAAFVGTVFGCFSFVRSDQPSFIERQVENAESCVSDHAKYPVRIALTGGTSPTFRVVGVAYPHPSTDFVSTSGSTKQAGSAVEWFSSSSH
ncbi:hypothetical protein D3C78_1000070 [compost metagenome]